MAPASMGKLYGTNNGFGWKVNEGIGAQVVSVPISLPIQNANRAFYTFMASLSGVFVVLFVILNLMLSVLIVRPITQMSDAADRISTGDMEIPEFAQSGRDEVALLARSFNRMRRSREKAVSLIDQKYPHFDGYRNRPPLGLRTARISHRAASRGRGLRADLSRHRLEPQPQGRDQGVPSRRPRPAVRRPIGPAEIRVHFRIVQVGPFAVSRRVAHTRLVPPSQHRARPAVFRDEQHRVHGDGICCWAAPRRMDPQPPAARASHRARDRRPAARWAGSHSSHRVPPPRYQARQRLHSRGRVAGAARLRFRPSSFGRKRADRHRHPWIRSDRAVPHAGPAGTMERLVRVWGSSVLDDHRQEARGGSGARAPRHAAARGAGGRPRALQRGTPSGRRPVSLNPPRTTLPIPRRGSPPPSPARRLRPGNPC